jgi:hypothetical protein
LKHVAEEQYVIEYIYERIYVSHIYKKTTVFSL